MCIRDSKEAMSFPSFDYFKLLERDFWRSDFYGYMQQKYLFVVFREDAVSYTHLDVYKRQGLTCEQVERRIAGILTEQGYAKDTYAQAIVDREANFPTALDMSGLNVAIPHCDVANVNKAAFCMAVLKHPVDWYKMDEPDETCKVSVCLLYTS